MNQFDGSWCDGKPMINEFGQSRLASIKCKNAWISMSQLNTSFSGRSGSTQTGQHGLWTLNVHSNHFGTKHSRRTWFELIWCSWVRYWQCLANTNCLQSKHLHYARTRLENYNFVSVPGRCLRCTSNHLAQSIFRQHSTLWFVTPGLVDTGFVWINSFQASL